jgi:hypothetical protein
VLVDHRTYARLPLYRGDPSIPARQR